MLVKTAIVVSLFVALSITAQVPPEVEPPPHPPLPEIDLQVLDSGPPTPPEESDRELQVLARNNDRIRGDYISTDEILGPNGQLLLGGSDLQLKVFTGPIRFMTNGSSTTGVERMRIAPDTGNISIGTTNAGDRKLMIVSSVAGSAFSAYLDRTFTQNASVSEGSGWSVMYSRVSEGVTQSGGAFGFLGRSFLFDKGTLNTAYGVFAEASVYPEAANTGTITNAYGLYSRVWKNYGVIANGFGLYLDNVNATNDWGVYQAGSDDENYFAGRVGIGTSAPAEMLHLSAAANTGLRMTHSDPTSGTNGIFFYEGSSLFGFINQRGSAHASARHFNLGNNDANGVTNLYAGGTNRMTLYANGNVGIGTTTAPTEKLSVVGDLRATGNITATTITGVTVIGAVYQDVAEWVPATVDMEPGTVVVLNHDRTNEVMPSHTPYDTSVAGVVSAQPGVLLGVAGDSKEQIATTGRVKVRVDATREPIRVGDLLVTSDVAGTAMRSEAMEINGRRFHQPGTIIGKALEPLASGTGEILVLLSLQ